MSGSSKVLDCRIYVPSAVFSRLCSLRYFNDVVPSSDGVIDASHGFSSDPIDWNCSSIVDEFVLLLYSIDIYLRISVPPFVFHERDVNPLPCLGKIVTYVLGVLFFTLYLRH